MSEDLSLNSDEIISQVREAARSDGIISLEGPCIRCGRPTGWSAILREHICLDCLKEGVLF